MELELEIPRSNKTFGQINEALNPFIEARIRKVEKRLAAWSEKVQHDKTSTDLYVIADLHRRKLAIENHLLELQTAPYHYRELIKRVVDMDLTDLETALRRMEPKTPLW